MVGGATGIRRRGARGCAEPTGGRVSVEDFGRPKLWLLRHGETEWSKSGQYTGLTDLPLTVEGEAQARQAKATLAGVDFGLVLTSPLQRARTTAALTGFPDAELEPDAVEWNYGDYEGI